MPREPASTANHFAPVAGAYAQFRPRYPAALYDWLATAAPGRGRAWDCACGSGQATLDLAERFDAVEATDSSAEQLAQAPAHPRVHYRIAPAEAAGCEPASLDLITVAQALHWFDCPRFYAQARRALRPGGVLAAWSYAICAIPADAGDGPLQHYYHDVVGSHWPAERSHVEDGYARLEFPTPRLPVPSFAMSVEWTLPQLLGYVGSWSATARYRAAHAADPVPALQAQLQRQWGDPAQRRTVRWPLTVLAAALDPGA